MVNYYDDLNDDAGGCGGGGRDGGALEFPQLFLAAVAAQREAQELPLCHLCHISK